MKSRPSTFVRSMQQGQETLVDLVDNLLNRGVMLDGELVLGLAGVDLIYLRLSVLLSAAERVLAPPDHRARPRRRRR
jgi:hypothetical protein